VPRFINFLKYALVMVLLVILIFFILLIIDVKSNPGKIKSVFGYVPMTVVSDSMSPYLNSGDLIVVKEVKPEKINCNDVISFKLEDNHIITHRAVEVFKNADGLKIKTKGDANEETDDWEVFSTNIIGVLCLKIPFAGYFVKSMASWKGIIIMMVIPLFAIISGELREVLSVRENIIREGR